MRVTLKTYYDNKLFNVAEFKTKALALEFKREYLCQFTVQQKVEHNIQVHIYK